MEIYTQESPKLLPYSGRYSHPGFFQYRKKPEEKSPRSFTIENMSKCWSLQCFGDEGHLNYAGRISRILDNCYLKIINLLNRDLLQSPNVNDLGFIMFIRFCTYSLITGNNHP